MWQWNTNYRNVYTSTENKQQLSQKQLPRYNTIRAAVTFIERVGKLLIADNYIMQYYC
jgi:hypothetical protein